MIQRPTIYEMVREAIVQLGGKATNADIRQYLRSAYPGVNDNSVSGYIILCTVNSPSRIHYPEHQKPRLANNPKYDVLYRTGRGQVAMYNSDVHGEWEIRKDDFGKLTIGRVGEVHQPPGPDMYPMPDLSSDGPADSPLFFPLESHLRDFIARTITSIKVGGRALQLYVDEHDDGVEYPTEVGPIDILAVDDAGNFVVFELKLSKGPDRAIGQIARYMGWVQAKLANGKTVSGVIVSSVADEKLKYAASIIPQVTSLEYEMKFDVHEVMLPS